MKLIGFNFFPGGLDRESAEWDNEFYLLFFKPFFRYYLSFLSHQFNSSHPLCLFDPPSLLLFLRHRPKLQEPHTVRIIDFFGEDETIHHIRINNLSWKILSQGNYNHVCFATQPIWVSLAEVAIVTLHIFIIFYPLPLLSTDNLPSPHSNFFFKWSFATHNHILLSSSLQSGNSTRSVYNTSTIDEIGGLIPLDSIN